MNLNDINDNCPTFPRPYEGPFDVTEGQPGPRVWTFLAHDDDSGPSGQVEYSIVAGDPLGKRGPRGVTSSSGSFSLMEEPSLQELAWEPRRKRVRKAILPAGRFCEFSLSTPGNPVLSNRKLNLFVASACARKGGNLLNNNGKKIRPQRET